MLTQFIAPGEDTIIPVIEDTVFVLDLKEKTSCSLTLEFDHPGVAAEIIGAYRLSEKSTLNLTTIALHKAPNTSCTTNIRGVLLDASSSNYIGKIIIEKPAQQTVSYLDDKVLSIGKGVKNASQPILQIDADDVKASHGATTGGIDKNQLYYLTSRGLSKEEAQDMIITGFFEQVLANVPEDTREKVFNNLGILK